MCPLLFRRFSAGAGFSICACCAAFSIRTAASNLSWDRTRISHNSRLSSSSACLRCQWLRIGLSCQTQLIRYRIPVTVRVAVTAIATAERNPDIHYAPNTRHQGRSASSLRSSAILGDLYPRLSHSACRRDLSENLAGKMDKDKPTRDESSRHKTQRRSLSGWGPSTGPRLFLVPLSWLCARCSAITFVCWCG
jgi:hypothetical protein